MNQNKNRVNYRFPVWLTVIFLLLILIPYAILSNQMILAKISGLLCLLVVIIAMRFWFDAAKQNSGVKDRVIINNNDWFDLERLYPSIYKWNKNDTLALRDRIGILLANVEFRKSSSELCNRIEAIEVAFQLSVYYWEEDFFTKDYSFVYMVTESGIRLIDINSNQELESLSLGFLYPTNSVKALKEHYRSLNQVSV
jgi:hypothetical protein